VGILIILVMVVGVRVKHAPAGATAAPATKQESSDLQALIAADRALAAETARLDGLVRRIENETALRSAERAELAALAEQQKLAIASQRQHLDVRAQAEFDLRRDLASAQARLDELRRQLEAADVEKPSAVMIENFPTPIGQTVYGKEAHVQLLGGRLTWIPLDELLARFKADAEERLWKLREQSEMANTVGPVGGFRLRYLIERVDNSVRSQLEDGRGGSYAQLVQWTLIPTSAQLGEPLDAALQSGSEFRRGLADLDRKRTTITVWTYADSFAAFRRLKKELYQQGFAVAGRPLPDGHPIGGSPEGSRSSAQ
jgi:hypothetical protein